MIDINEKEMIKNEIDNFTNLQRIQKADDMKKEVDYQISISKAKLQSFGIVTEDLEIK